MPSPFPGMDPYLEGPLWTTFHFSLAAEIVRQLAPKVQPRYLVLPIERQVMDIPASLTIAGAYPDVGIVDTSPEGFEGGGTAGAMAPLRVATVIPEHVPHVSVEIRDAAQRELVAAIEILSPTNKRGSAYQKYLSRRERILSSTAHLMEIDLLRAGQRVPMRDPLPPAPYFVFLSRAEDRPMTEVWPIALNRPLPTVPVPLRAPDADALLDLQLAFTAVYDLLRYDIAIDYSKSPEVPLKGEAAQWAEARIKAGK